jgi:hypothetical protein
LEANPGGFRTPKEGHPTYSCSIDFFAWLFQGVQEHDAKSDVRRQDQCCLGNGKWEEGFMHYMLRNTEEED